MSPRARRALATLASVVLLAGCSAGPDSRSQPAADTAGDAPGESAGDAESRTENRADDRADAVRPEYRRYVALGDSFTAAPLVPHTALAEGCFRSDGNYPNLVADRLDVDTLVDVSCSGAETKHLVERQHTVENGSVPPQLRAVNRRTDLVTLGIGGNDFDLFGTLVSACSRLGRQQPSDPPCAGRLAERGVDLLGDTRRIGSRVEASVRRVRERAPEATVVVVGYPRLTPSSGGCRALPFAPGDHRYGARVSEALNDALSRATEAAGARFLDMHALSEGHDICSDEPWVNGARTVRGEALAFHPFASGQEAVADALVEVLEEESAPD